MTPPSWRPGSIDSAASACEFVASVWDDERIPPMRLHEHAVQPRDLLGAPRWSSGFSHYLMDDPFETVIQRQGYTEGDHFIRTGPDREFWKYPLRRCLALLRNEHWPKTIEDRPEHPHILVVLAAMDAGEFDLERIVLRYTNGTVVPADMRDLFIIVAARKIKSKYQEEVLVPIGQKSEAQQIAEAS